MKTTGTLDISILVLKTLHHLGVLNLRLLVHRRNEISEVVICQHPLVGALGSSCSDASLVDFLGLPRCGSLQLVLGTSGWHIHHFGGV